jgi:hypothetical protein
LAGEFAFNLGKLYLAVVQVSMQRFVAKGDPCCILPGRPSVFGRNLWLGLGLGLGLGLQVEWLFPFSVWTEFTAPTGERSGHPRGMPMVTRMQELQASRREIQWHPRVQISVGKRAPYTADTRAARVTLVAKGGWLLEREEHRTPQTLVQPGRRWLLRVAGC